jgi:hypothetical protein
MVKLVKHSRVGEVALLGEKSGVVFGGGSPKKGTPIWGVPKLDGS